jgi:DNA-binding transcriptional regulator YiaG
MANLAVALKDEIRRLAKKEVKALTGSTKEAVVQYRRDIARLKRQVQEQQRKLAFLESQEKKRISKPEVAEGEMENVRFSARSVRAQRKRLRLSAEDYAKLLGVSALTVYNWENGKSRPRQAQFAALVALRGMGRREAIRRLDLLDEKKQ